MDIAIKIKRLDCLKNEIKTRCINLSKKTHAKKLDKTGGENMHYLER